MTFEAIPPILAAPLEIRHAIYRYVWTIQSKAYFDIGRGTYTRDRENVLGLQIKRLVKLVSICQQMRYEVLSEYFHRTQIYLDTRIDVSFYSPPPYVQSSLVITSSALFTSYTQNVMLRLYRYGRVPDKTEILDWLLQLKQLKTLDLVVLDWRMYLGEGIQDHDIAAVVNEYFGPSQMHRFTALRNLERIRVIFCSCWERSTKIADGTPEFQRLKRILSESVREDLRQVWYTPVRVVPLELSPASLKIHER
ncbi:hypothetical protein QBC32DRAFT_352391 [Pseudoneurospora amorphoporcata]|uniref:Uncharacterized protein n=1 Tax=Pseudoneurospora amorphoporcata TaxID=241081 RepID=A0AAN6SC22_9PEZI|nr:hypothetical protein QBC32DRAFT_352391 [Pseudoneurospora amorphoporcata]